jgi:hypothetical protein
MRVCSAWLVAVAACVWSTPASPPPPPPPPPPQIVAAPPPPPAPSPAPAPADAGAPFAQPPPAQVAVAPITCGADEVWEALCGGMGTGKGTCGPTADTNASWGYQRLVVTQITGGKKDPALKRFTLDDAETSTYAASIPPSGAGLPGPFCCHSRCTPLRVARAAASPKLARGYHLEEVCIPPPVSTNAPSREAPACPGAVELRGTLVAFSGAHKPKRLAWWYRANGGKACCYNVVAKDAPPDHDMGHCPTCKCAAAGTPIATPDGDVPIESLDPGDLVLSMDRGALRAVPLAAVNRTRVHDHVLVVATLANGRTVAMSPLHPTADGHHFADLTAGSQLGDVSVVSVERVPYAGEYTYDLLPASDTATYVAAGALVGSTLEP